MGKPRLYLPPRQVFPSGGDLHLRCGQCGGTTFKAHVQPQHQGARMRYLECAGCAKLIEIDEQGWVSGTGKIQEKEPARPT